VIRGLPEPMVCYRIGDPGGDYPIWDAGGARQVDGRWHEAGASVIYAAEHYSTAMLEKLVHYAGEMPPNQHFLTVTLPLGISYEVANPDALEGWARADCSVARAFGRRWYGDGRSAVLIVPSVAARMERNLVINALHPDFGRIRPGLEMPVWWDARLFG
jgi:RES domain-containing protein